MLTLKERKGLKPWQQGFCWKRTFVPQEHTNKLCQCAAYMAELQQHASIYQFKQWNILQKMMTESTMQLRWVKVKVQRLRGSGSLLRHAWPIKPQTAYHFQASRLCSIHLLPLRSIVSNMNISSTPCRLSRKERQWNCSRAKVCRSTTTTAVTSSVPLSDVGDGTLCFCLESHRAHLRCNNR